MTPIDKRPSPSVAQRRHAFACQSASPSVKPFWRTDKNGLSYFIYIDSQSYCIGAVHMDMTWRHWLGYNQYNHQLEFYTVATPKDRSDQGPKCPGTKVTAHSRTYGMFMWISMHTQAYIHW